MLDNKAKIVGLIVVLVIIVVGITTIVKKNKEENFAKSQETSVEYNEETGEYYILDSENNIVATTMDESEVKILQDDPTYDPKLPSGDM